MSDIDDEPEETLEFTDWEGMEDKFAIRVNGDAMGDAHIVDGDYVIIQRQDWANEGQIALILDGEGAGLLRTYHMHTLGARFEAADGNKTPAIIREKPAIFGVLVGVVRKY